MGVLSLEGWVDLEVDVLRETPAASPPGRGEGPPPLSSIDVDNDLRVSTEATPPSSPAP